MASEAGLLDKVYADARDIRIAIHQSSDLRVLLQSPVVNTDQKSTILRQIFKDQLEMTREFALFLVRKKREMFLDAMCESFIEQYHELKCIATAKVISAFPLDAGTIESVKKYLSATFGKKQIILENVIDKTIIGGMVIHYEDRLLDMSISKELREIRKQLIYN